MIVDLNSHFDSFSMLGIRLVRDVLIFVRISLYFVEHCGVLRLWPPMARNEGECFAPHEKKQNEKQRV